ncbi:C-5 sterol desaturase [Maudiozyma humilis]|uniref:C-5 sterol desaturase n=1 Tax=Maudiozyma humilis TaxID=51915 RepID=A0AAV5RZP0_MAUHU|nr:C-5 sterol desaturase [Kazachstania humilis]
MDLVLEVADRYVFDAVYAKLLPVSLAASVPAKWVSLLDLNDGFIARNATLLAQTLEYRNNISPRVNEPLYGHTPFLLDMTATAFMSVLPRYNILREFVSLTLITTVFGWLLYLSMATASYFLVFDKTIFNHPRYLKNQMVQEIRLAVSAIPLMSALTAPWFTLECNGHSRLYWTNPKKDWHNYLIEVCAFIFFTDCGVYFAHRWLHWPLVYKYLHKPHHKWIVCTPFASHAFHPLDGYGQSISYHVYPMIFPLQKLIYLGLFVFVNFWTIMIHDGNHMYNNKVVNGTACHTVHHLYFSYNFGQFTTLWDRLGGSYRRPEDSLFDPSLKNDAAVLAEQLKDVDKEMKEIEGDLDEREYDDHKKKNN